MLHTLESHFELQTIKLSEPGQAGGQQPWGWHLVLNMYDCEPGSIRSGETIEKFVVDLCDLLEMRRFGQPVIVDFGDDPRVTGYSMFQLIETSNIAGHFANQSNRAYIDIFSCKQFDPQAAAQFCLQTFGARGASGVFIHRD